MKITESKHHSDQFIAKLDVLLKSYGNFKVCLIVNWEKSYYFGYFVKITHNLLYILDHKIKVLQSFEAN